MLNRINAQHDHDHHTEDHGQTKEKNLEHQLFVLDTFASLMPEVDHDHHHGHHDDDDSYDDDDEIQILGASLPDPG